MRQEAAKVAAVEGTSRGFHYGWAILGVGILVVMGALGLARFGYTMILPQMQEGLSLGNTQMGLLATGNFVGYLVFALFGGFLASKYGPRFIITISMTLVAVTMLFMGLVSGFTGALALRTLTGIGSGGSNVPIMGLVSSWFGPRRRGMAAGLMVGGSGLGLVFTGFLIADTPWRQSWFILAAAAFVITVLAALVLRNHPSQKGLQPIGGKSEASSGATGSLEWGRVYRLPALWHLAAVYAFFGFSYSIYATFFKAFLQKEMGMDPQVAGYLWAVVGFISIVSGLMWGSLSDVIGRKYGLALVFFLQGTSFLIFGRSTAEPGFYVSAILFGLTAWSIPGIMAAACGDYVGARLAPAALGFITLVFGVGQAAGPGIAGYMADLFSSLGPAFTLSAAVAYLGAMGSLLLKPPDGRL